MPLIMPDANKTTVTGKTGPGITVTARALTYVTDMDFDLRKKVLRVVSSEGTSEFDLAVTTTVTYTISGGVATVTIS